MPRRSEENTLKKYLSNTVLKRFCHLQSIEDRYSTGICDMSYCVTEAVQYPEGFMELKQFEEWPARAGTTLKTKLRHLTRDQVNWMRIRHNHGGRVFILLKVVSTEEYLLFHGKDAKALKESTREEAYALAINVWQGGIPSWELKQSLTS